MIDYAFTAFALGGGFIIGLITGIVRRHGVVWTLIDCVIGGVAGIAFVFLWFYGLGGIPDVREAINRLSRQYPVFGSVISFITLMTPAIGAIIGLWLVSKLRHRTGSAAA